MGTLNSIAFTDPSPDVQQWGSLELHANKDLSLMPLLIYHTGTAAAFRRHQYLHSFFLLPFSSFFYLFLSFSTFFYLFLSFSVCFLLVLRK